MLADITGLSTHFTADSLRAYLLERATRDAAGCLIIRGYGSRRGTYQKVAGRAWAHIAAYVVFVGGYDPALEVEHTCGVKDCIEPAHLRQVTHAETCRNRRQRPYCRDGHVREFDEATGRYRRGCRECNRQAQRRWRQRQAAEVARARVTAGRPPAATAPSADDGRG